MTREQAKELLPVIKAFNEGKTIECIDPKEKNDRWEVTCAPTWNPRFEYRVKPEPYYRPFKDGEECWQEMQRHNPFGWVKMNEECCHINRVGSDYVSVSDIDNYEFDEIYEYVTFADGTPFGIKEEEQPCEQD